MNRMKNKFHRDTVELSPKARRILADIENMSSEERANIKPLFDRLSTTRKVFFLAVLVLLVPLWFPMWIYQQLRGSK
jgi:hypothetical protein